MKYLFLLFFVGCAHSDNLKVFDSGCMKTEIEAYNKIIEMVKKECGGFVNGEERSYTCVNKFSKEMLGYGVKYSVKCSWLQKEDL